MQSISFPLKINRFCCSGVLFLCAVHIWSILDTLRHVTKQESKVTFDLDRILADKIVGHVLQLNSICSDRMGTMHMRIHPLKSVT